MNDLNKFLKKKIFKNVLGEFYKFSRTELDCLEEIGKKYGFPPDTSLSKRTIDHIPVFLKYKLYDICDRIEKIKLCRRNSQEHYIFLFGNKEGHKRYEMRTKKCSNNLERYIEKYGEEKGTEIFQKNNLKRGPTLKNYIRRHGEEKGTEEFEKYKKKCSFSHKIEGYIEKYGEEQGTEIFNSLYSTPRLCLERMIDKYGEEGILKYAEIRKNISKKFQGGRASKESLEVFLPILQKYLDLKYYIGYEDNREYYLWNIEHKEFYTYDLCFPDFNLIFEYNGEHVHPNKFKLTDQEWEDWKCAWTGRTADEAYNYDERKIKTANTNGFKVVVLWRNEGIDILKEIVNKELIKYANN